MCCSYHMPLPLTRNPIAAQICPMMENIANPVRNWLLEVEDILRDEVPSGIESADAVVSYIIKNGGKRIRPLLFLLSARLSGADGRELPRLAAALEMIHTASLLHDDVIDEALMRRGRPSANARWGNQVSVLVGDLLLCRASRILTEHGDWRLMKAVTTAIAETTAGELLEIAHQNNASINEDTYMKIISGKTAAFFSLAASGGAIVAGLNGELENGLKDYGFHLGCAFQLADDVLDYTAEEGRFGKNAGTDLRGGKLTYPLILAMKEATKAEQRIISQALNANQQAKENLSEVASIIERYGGITATIDLAKGFSERAKRHLAVFKPSPEHDSLFALADYVVERRE